LITRRAFLASIPFAAAPASALAAVTTVDYGPAELDIHARPAKSCRCSSM
jgi:hypothetical protein